MATLEELKEYLGVDGSHLDSLLASFLSAANEIVESVLRYPLSELNPYPALVDNALKYVVAKLYTEREQCDMGELKDMVAKILEPIRKKVF
jgi:hypothetical protein